MEESLRVRERPVDAARLMPRPRLGWTCSGALRCLVGFVVACSPGTSSRLPAQSAETSSPARSLLVPRPGVTLAARVVGPEGAPVVLAIGGGPGYSHGYMEVFERLAARASPMRVVTFDARGTGASVASSDASFTLAENVDDVDAVRVAVGANDVVLLGHSYGALVAESYSITHPERVRALVVVDGMPHRRADLHSSIEVSRERARVLGASGLYRAPRPPDADDCTAAMNADLALDFADPHHPAARALERTSCSAATASKTFGALGDYDLAEGLGSLRAPTFLAFGNADPNRFELEKLREQLSRTVPAVATFDACGHYPFLECAPEFFAALAAFLDDTAREPRKPPPP